MFLRSLSDEYSAILLNNKTLRRERPETMHACDPNLLYTWCDKLVHALHCGGERAVVCDEPSSRLDEYLSRWRDKCVPLTNACTGGTVRALRLTNGALRAACDPRKKLRVLERVRVEPARAGYAVRWPRLPDVHRQTIDLLTQRRDAEPHDQWRDDDTCAFLERVVDEDPTSRELLARKFYRIARADNLPLYLSGDLLTRARARSLPVDALNSKLAAPFEALMLAVVDGVRDNKTDVEYKSVNNKTYRCKTFSLAIKPVLFFIVDD
ncbi:DBP [Lymantria xylina nucleopolyhedrovirus]|uniref:DBP n=1 Tax=Lymantria xylina multiple nucleopolyhedrovirus TaxID=2847840 RepID=D4N270_9ABAC|nr:DBP [Lymantria xylina nucleopolyhedrovirus]ADD73742.1 DBP [Lymantria xylina nucleopolyhedrovirus]